jgi:signal transduction histidine kinase/CheY-like chemotaxis protein
MSSAPQHRFAAELRAPTWPAAAAVMGASLLVVWFTAPHPVLFPLAAIAGIALLLNSRQPLLAGWLLIAAVVAAIALGWAWLEIPGLLALLAVPAALAAVLISLPAAIGCAVAESVLLVAGPAGLPLLPGLRPAAGPETLVALVAIWASMGVMVLGHYPVANFATWAEGYYQRVQAQLDEAVERKMALEQALEDLTLASRQLALANERLAALRNIAEEAQQTKAAFVAKVSHEFRTPLNMIIGLVDLMVKSPEVYGKKLPRALLEDLAIVQRNCEHLAGLVNDVLDLSQVEVGRLTLHPERVRLPDICAEALAVVHPLLHKKGLELHLAVPDDLPEIYCDRTRIRQVILNLLSNAARFTEQGHIEIRMEQRRSALLVSIRDTGPGIAPEDVDRIFEPFCQGTQPLWRDKGGTGLGLSISKQFVELHGGRIWLESELGRGTTFHFELPISPDIEAIARPTRWLSEEWIWHARNHPTALPDLAARPRVLLCDASGNLQVALSRFADEMEVVRVTNLADASQMVKECPVHMAVVNVPSPEALWPTIAAARQQLPDTPVAGCLIPAHVQRLAESRALDYLVKPITRADLQNALARAGLSGHAAARHTPGETAPAASDAAPTPTRRILVVDDDPEVVMLWTRMLHLLDGGLEILTEASGTAALAALQRHHPDLMLLDIMLPDITGWAVLAQKNADQDIAGIPVILVTAQDPAEEPVRSEAMVLTMAGGLSIGKLLRGSIAASDIMLGPD